MLTKKVSIIKVCIVLRNLQNLSEGGWRQYILALLLLSPQVLQPLGNRNAIFTTLSNSNIPIYVSFSMFAVVCMVCFPIFAVSRAQIWV